jgi:hypothetical protein
MAAKRELEDFDEGEVLNPQPKRPKKQGGKTRQHQNSGIDPTWGQKYVFAGNGHTTTIPEGEEDDFEDDSEAMAYLNSVRYALLLCAFVAFAEDCKTVEHGC